MESIWNGIERPQFPSLQGDTKTDILVIGGGLCGILCAYMLKKSGVDCVLAEADRICAGVTNGTTAKITFQHGLIYDKIIKKYGIHFFNTSNFPMLQLHLHIYICSENDQHAYLYCLFQ